MTAFEGNGYFDESYLLNSSIGTSIFTGGVIKTSSINMLNIDGNYQTIINTAEPINDHDVAIKLTVSNLGININNITLLGTQGTVVTNSIGSFVVTVSNQILNGPCATFHVSKNNPTICGQVIRITAVPGISLSKTCLLKMDWPPNSALILYKTDINFDGSYTIKLM